MTNDRRLTTDRFYGGTSQRLQVLQQFLFFLEDEPRTRKEAKDWILTNTNARSRDAMDHHFGFLETIELIDLTDDKVSIDWRGNQYLESTDPSVLYDTLRSNVKGFDSVLSQLLEGPMTDKEIMHHLRNEFEDIEMESPGVAARHREWLQVLGYVDRSVNSNSLTKKGRKLATRVADDNDLNNQERVQKLRQRLLETEMDCVPAGQQNLTDDIYPAVKSAYPDLCDDSYRCEEAHENGRDQPEWKHAARDIQQRIADHQWGRVRRQDELGKWLYLPRFEIGETYNRSNLHDCYGGMRQSGIAPTRDFPLVFLFTSSSGEDHGYEDEFRDDGTVIYTGEGREGRMTYDRGNKAVGDHQKEQRELHLFEYVTQGIVEYKGQYECVDQFREDLPDTNDEIRSAIQFKLEPTETVVDNESDFSTNNGLQTATAEDSPPETGVALPEGNITTERRERTRDDVVRDETLVRKIKRMYNDRCQICGERRLSNPETGYSEVHHLMALGDSGPDIPENVVVVCPNHHVDLENGMLSIDPETLEIAHRYDTDIDGRELVVEDGHKIGREYIAYHNQVSGRN